jgi:hypothetical protein
MDRRLLFKKPLLLLLLLFYSFSGDPSGETVEFFSFFWKKNGEFIFFLV